MQNRKTHLTAFLDEAVQRELLRENCYINQGYPSFKIAEVRPPEIVLYAAGMSGKEWKRRLSLRIGRAEGRLFLKSRVLR